MKQKNMKWGDTSLRMVGKNKIILIAELIDLMIKNSKRQALWKSKFDDKGEFILLMECLGLYVWGYDPESKNPLSGWGFYMTKLGYDVFKLLNKRKWFKNDLWKMNRNRLK